jgi:hypothetical protein
MRWFVNLQKEYDETIETFIELLISENYNFTCVGKTSGKIYFKIFDNNNHFYVVLELTNDHVILNEIYEDRTVCNNIGSTFNTIKSKISKMPTQSI